MKKGEKGTVLVTALIVGAILLGLAVVISLSTSSTFERANSMSGTKNKDVTIIETIAKANITNQGTNTTADGIEVFTNRTSFAGVQTNGNSGNVSNGNSNSNTNNGNSGNNGNAYGVGNGNSGNTSNNGNSGNANGVGNGNSGNSQSNMSTTGAINSQNGNTSQITTTQTINVPLRAGKTPSQLYLTLFGDAASWQITNVAYTGTPQKSNCKTTLQYLKNGEGKLYTTQDIAENGTWVITLTTTTTSGVMLYSRVFYR